MHCPMSLVVGRGCLALSGCVLYANLSIVTNACLARMPGVSFFARKVSSGLLCAQFYAAVFKAE